MFVRNCYRNVLLPLLLLTTAALAPGTARAETEWVTHTGDILQIALPVFGGISTFFTNPDPDKSWDREGTRQFALSYGSSWTTTYVLKYAAGKARPNGDNRTSFPSGHTMSAFAGAAFIDGRYGKTFGIPAYAMALFTGYSRVQSNWHYRDDVIAGASIGAMYAWHFVSPQPGKLSLLPTVSAQGIGLTATIGGGEKDPAPVDVSSRGASYVFGFGPAYLVTNVAASRGDGGTEFQLSDLDGNNDPTTTASASVGIPAGRRGRVSITYGPFEARDVGSFDYNVSFGGAEFPAGTPVNSAWRFYDLYATYEYAVVDASHWRVGLGAGAGIMYSYTALETQDGVTGAIVDDTAYYPFGAASVGYFFSPRVGLEVAGQGVSIGDDWLYDARADLIWRAAQAWDFALGYKYFGRQIESDTYFNKTRYGIPHLAVTRYW